MERCYMERLRVWKERASGKPLLVLGARQTGKSWLLSEFGRRYFKDVVRLDFMLNKDLADVFALDLDPHRIVSQLELRLGRTIDPANTLLILDEIQEAPRGLTSLKYFCEQAPEYHVAAAGSYMGLALRREGESFPVGKVETLIMRPMRFVEFVRAVYGEPLARALEAADMAMLSGVADVLVRALKDYFVIGGMPEVVDSFARNRDYEEARRLQNEILLAYDADFSKHAPVRLVERMRMAWQSLPGQLAHENSRFVYSAVRPGARARDFEEALQWLADYGVVGKVPRVAALRFPLSAYEDLSAFKLFCVDVGLLGAMSGLPVRVVLQEHALFTEFKGSLTEQYVFQELVADGFEPVYWSNEAGRAETDFSVALNGTVLPIEVKAGENLRSKSLRVACDKFGLERAIRTSLSGYRDDGWLVNIPLWAIGSLRALA